MTAWSAARAFGVGAPADPVQLAAAGPSQPRSRVHAALHRRVVSVRCRSRPGYPGGGGDHMWSEHKASTGHPWVQRLRFVPCPYRRVGERPSPAPPRPDVTATGGRTGCCASWSPCTATCPGWPRRTPTWRAWCGWSRTAPGRRWLVLGPAQQPLAAAPAGAAERLDAAIGAAALAPVLAAAAQNRRPMSLPGLGAEPGTVAVAPIMVNHDVVAHLVTVRPAGPTPAGPELDDDLNLLLTEHAATICGIILGRERAVAAAGAPGPHRADRGPAAGPRPRRRRGRALGRPPRLPARRRAPRVRGGACWTAARRAGQRAGRRTAPRMLAPGRAGHPAQDPGGDRRGARLRGGRGGPGPARLEGRAWTTCARWPSSAGRPSWSAIPT